MRAGLVMAIVAVLAAANIARLHRPGHAAHLRAEHAHSAAGESRHAHHDHAHVHTHAHGHWHGDLYHAHEHSHHGDREHWDDADHDSRPHDDHAHVRGANPDEDQRLPMPEMLRQRRDHQSGGDAKAAFAPAMMVTLPEPSLWRRDHPPRGRDAPLKALQRAVLTSVILQI